MALGSKRNYTKHTKYGSWHGLHLGLSRRSIFIGAAFMLIAEIGHTAYMKETYLYAINSILSYADCFVILESTVTKLLYLIPIYLCFVMQLIHRDENIQFLIRQNRRSGIWIKRFCKVFMISLWMSIYQIFAIYIVAGLLAKTPINWNEEGSFFWLMTEGSILSGDMVKMDTVVITFFAISLITFFFIGSLFALCQWVTGSMIVGWIVCMGLGIYELFPGPELFFKRVSIFFDKWIGGYPYIKVFLFSGVAILCLFYLGILIAKRKEFIGER